MSFIDAQSHTAPGVVHFRATSVGVAVLAADLRVTYFVQ